MTQYGPVEWWYANGQLAINQRAAVFGPGDTNTFAPIFADAAMTVALPNPTTTDASGMLTFYAPDGQYFIFVGPVGTGDSVEVILGAAPGAVDSVNGQTGNVTLDAADVSADPVGAAAAAAAASQPLVTIDAKGDLYAGTANNTTARRSVGTNGQVLTADSAQPTGLSWTTPAGGAVDSVNGQTGVVVLTAADVSADPAGSAAAAAAASQPIATINAKGDLYAGTGDNATTRLPVGVDGRVLTADSAQATGLTWSLIPSAPVTSVNGETGAVILDAADVSADPAGSAAAAAAASQPLATIDAKGDLYAGTANNTTARRGVGTNGQVLTADSSDPTGLAWTTPTAAPVTSVNGETGAVVLDAADVSADPAGAAAAAQAASQPLDGDLTAIAALAPPDDDVIQRKAGAWTARTMAQLKSDLVITAADVGAQPIATITTKGDLYVGTANAATTRRGVGTDGQVLTADSAQADGVKWAAAGVDAGAQQRSTLTTKGDLYVATASATTTRQGVGTDGFGLVSDSTLTNGIGWKVRSSVGIYPRSTGYSPAGMVGTTRSSKSATQDTMFLIPSYLLVGATLSSLAFEVSGAIALAVVRLGIYGSDATMLPTGAPIADYGTTLAATTGTKTAAVSTALAPGLYWIAVVGQTVAPTLRFSAGQSPWVANATFPSGSGVGWNNAFAQTGVSGALPTIGTITDSDAPLIGLKF